MWPLFTLITGIALCVAGGLLGLVADHERPWRFIPGYVLATAFFLTGMALIFWFQPIGEYARSTLAR